MNNAPAPEGTRDTRPSAARPASHPVPQVRSFETVAALRQAAGPAWAADLGEDMFFTPAWFDNLAANGIDAACKPMWLLVHGEPGEVLCAPLMWQPRGSAAVFGPVIASLANYYSSLYAPAAAAPPSPTACRALAAFLRRSPRRAGVLDLHPLDTEGPFFARLQVALRDEGWQVDEYFCFGNWHLAVRGRSFDNYYTSVPSRIRNTIRRGRKKLDDAGPWSLQIQAEPGPALEQAIRDFDAIYRKSWKVPEPFPEFVPGLCRTAAAQGWLRLGVVRLGDVPIASQLWLVRRGKAQIYKLAYDEDYKRFSAGSVLSAEMMRRALDVDQVLDVDYLTGDDGYKADWMSNRRVRKGLVAFDLRTPQGLVSAIRHRLGRWRHRGHADPSALPTPATTSGAVED